MKTTDRLPVLSLVLFLLGLFMSILYPGILIVDYGPPMAVRLLVVAVPLVIIPFAIGWFTPPLWWIAGACSIIPMFFAIMALATSPPIPAAELLSVWPLFLPLILTLAFALLGKVSRQRR